jgi:hypothetical protein
MKTLLGNGLFQTFPMVKGVTQTPIQIKKT